MNVSAARAAQPPTVVLVVATEVEGDGAVVLGIVVLGIVGLGLVVPGTEEVVDCELG
jgi:hypothetical protein